MSTIKPRIFKGARDFLPEEMIRRERIADVMRKAFRRCGFQPIETPAIEYLSVLSGKYGDEADRLIYRLNYKTGSKDEAALHYDLTVPFSRVIAMNPNLPKPFKRYQIQPVWRADTPQPKQGRFREFYQCDVDVIGSKSMVVDAEIITVVNEVLTDLGFEGFIIKVNNRKLLNGLVQYVGLDGSHTQTVCRSIDKLDKVPFSEVAKELADKGYETATIDNLEKVIHIDADGPNGFDELDKLFAGIDIAEDGLTEMRELLAFTEAMGIPRKNMRFDLSLARGLDYYTGPIFETRLPEHPHIGSLTGGGRYDELIGLFSGQPTPAVGTSLGLDRIYTAMQQLDMFSGEESSTKALVVNFSEETQLYGLRIVRMLREAAVNAELYPDAAKLKKQFSYADNKQIPYVIIAGDDEIAAEKASLKNMETGEQDVLRLGEIVDRLSAGQSELADCGDSL